MREIERDIRKIQREIEPLTQGVESRTREARKERLQSVVWTRRKNISCATKIQALYRGCLLAYMFTYFFF